jgi:hypothetical protein
MKRSAAILLLAAIARPSPATAQRTVFRGFADFSARLGDKRGTPPGFGFGQLDAFVTSSLNDRISFLTEVVFEYDDGHFVPDIERVQVAFQVAPHLKLSAGKHHTPLGHWNTTYHHGALIQPTIERPLVFRFEDDGGVLPIHATGVMLSGRGIGASGLGFDVMVANGLGSPPNAEDDQAKSATLAAFGMPAPGLRLGVFGHVDRMAAGSTTHAGTELTEDVSVRIVGGFAKLDRGPLEVIAEGLAVRAASAGGGVSWTRGGYAYVGIATGELTPYALVDALKVPDGNPLFVADRKVVALLGARMDLGPVVVVKVEAGRESSRVIGAATLARTQVAISF